MIKSGTNSQYDFLEFFTYLCDEVLCPGDYLVMDNCAIHVADETANYILELAKAADIKMIFLPKYSPELNPCELIFSQVKNYLSANRSTGNWDQEVMFALSLVSVIDVFLMYYECVWMDFLDPLEY